jgi:hypothetical protein
MTGRDITIQFLRAFIQGGTQPGDLIELGPLHFPVRVHFPAAMAYAAEQGWVERSDADKYRLTDTGFEAAQISK